MAGTNFVEALTAFETDPDTHAIILVGEIGGATEDDAVEWIKDYKRRTTDPKPIAAVIGGILAREGTIMGHAGAFRLPGDGTSNEKIKNLESVGVTVVDHPTKLGSTIKTLMQQSGRGDKIVGYVQNTILLQLTNVLRQTLPCLLRDAATTRPAQSQDLASIFLLRFLWCKSEASRYL